MLIAHSGNIVTCLTNIECYNSEFEFEYIIQSLKIRPSFNILNSEQKMSTRKEMAHDTCASYGYKFLVPDS